MIIEDKDIFTLLGAQSDPAAAVRDGVVVYSNHSAESLIMPKMTGRPAAALLPPELLGLISGPCRMDARLFDEDMSVFVMDLDGLRIFIFDPPLTGLDAAGAVAGAIGRGIREQLAVSGANLSLLVRRAIESSDVAAINNASKLTRSLTRLERQTDNSDRYFQDYKMTPSRKKIDLLQLIGDLVAEVNTLPLEPKISFVSRVASMPFLADADLMRVAVLNLLSNSFKAVRSGGSITVEFGSASSRVITVSDTGSGIEGLAGVFTAFERPAGLSAPGAGTGFGLSVVRKIMSLHGGWVMLEARPGGGTCVSLRFPSPDPALDSMPLSMPGPSEPRLFLLELSDVLPSEAFRAALLES